MPRSGCLTIRPTGTSSSSSATTKSSTRSWPSRRWNHQASISGIAIFRISLGWITTPTLSQRVAPFLVTPNTATATSSATPTAYSGTASCSQRLRRDLGDDEHHAQREQHVARRGRRSACRESKPAEYIVTSPAAPSSSIASSSGPSKPVKTGLHAPPQRGPLEDGVHQGLSSATAPAPPTRGRGGRRRARHRGCGTVDRRARQRHGRAPGAARRSARVDWPSRVAAMSASLGYMPEQHVVEHAARDRRRGAGAEAGVLDHQRERDARLVERRERGVQRVVAVALVDRCWRCTSRSCLMRDHLRGAGLAAGLVRRAGERRAPTCLPASRRTSRWRMKATCSGFQASGRQRPRRSGGAASRVSKFSTTLHQVRPVALARRRPGWRSPAPSCSIVKAL